MIKPKMRQEIERASELLTKSKNLIDQSKYEINGSSSRLKAIQTLYHQGELFINTPVYDEKLSRQCLDSLVETF